jgi:hypothetical protein
VPGCFFLRFTLQTRHASPFSPGDGSWADNVFFDSGGLGWDSVVSSIRCELMMERREIKARDFVRDMRSGMSNVDLMHKYKLSLKGLRSVFSKLLSAEVIKPQEIFRRSMLNPDMSDLRVFPVRLLSRKRIEAPLAVYIYDQALQETKGLVSNVSERGIGIEGIEAEEHQTQIFVIPSGEVAGVGRITFEAKCKWTRRIADFDICESGHEIVSISEESLAEFLKLMKETTWSDDAAVED